MKMAELAPGLRADQIIGTEVQSSDDKIVRNIVFGLLTDISLRGRSAADRWLAILLRA